MLIEAVIHTVRMMTDAEKDVPGCGCGCPMIVEE